MHADDAGRFPVDRGHQQAAVRGLVETLQIGQLAQGGGLDGGEVAVHDLLQPPAIPRQERPGHVEVVGDKTLVMAIVARYMT